MSDETEIENEDASGASPNAKRLTQEQWEEIERSYRMGEEKIPILSARYGVSAPTISKRFKAKGVVFAMDRPDPNAQAAAQAAAIIAQQQAAQPKKTFAEKREENVEKTKQTSYDIHNAIQVMIGTMIRDFVGPNKVLPQTKMADIKALNWLAKTNEIARIGRYAILDILPEVNTEDLPNMAIDDLHDLEVEELARRNGDDEDEEESLVGDQDVEIEGIE